MTSDEPSYDLLSAVWLVTYLLETFAPWERGRLARTHLFYTNVQELFINYSCLMVRSAHHTMLNRVPRGA